jgi:hypothetical protein
MTARRSLARGSVALLFCLALASGAAASAAAGTPAGARVLLSTSPGSPRASAAAACKPPHYPSLGYFTSITVTRASCATATKLVRAFFKCRTKSGLAGKCHKTVLGFKCTEVRNSIPTEIDALDTCKHGSEKVVSGWQQDIN